MIWQFVVTVFVLWILLDYWKRRKLLELASKIPSVKQRALPLVGHTYIFLGSDEDRMSSFIEAGREAITSGGLATFWFGRHLLLVCSDAACAETVLKYCLDKNDLMNYIRDVTGNGIIFTDVNIWRPRRKVMAPVFSPKTLNKFTEVFSRQSQILVKQLENVSNSKQFSVWKYVTTYTMESVCETNLGIQLSSNPDDKFLKAFYETSELVAKRICQPWLQLELIYPWTRHFAQMAKLKEVLYGFIEDIIKTKRKENEEKNNKLNPSEIQNDRFKTFLEMLIENSGGPKGYTDLELREETFVIAIAGTDTSAVGTCFTLGLLARFPTVQNKVYMEIKEIFGTSDRSLTPEDLPRLKYLECVVKESLRLYPPVPVIARKVEKDIDLPSGHTLIPGVGVLINIFGIHRNPRYWGADADEFRPERFLDGPLHPAAFVPFSYGPRNCIGYQYAMMSMKTAISAIVRKYKVLPPTSGVRSNGVSSAEIPKEQSKGPGEIFRLKFDIMMKDVDDFQIRLEKR